MLLRLWPGLLPQFTQWLVLNCTDCVQTVGGNVLVHILNARRSVNNLQQTGTVMLSAVGLTTIKAAVGDYVV